MKLGKYQFAHLLRFLFISNNLCYSETLKTSRHYNGKAVATYPNGDTYDGYFTEGLRHGENGLYTYTSKGTEDAKDTYRGAWEENKKHGIGKQVYTDVGEYNGYWACG